MLQEGAVADTLRVYPTIDAALRDLPRATSTDQAPA